MRAAAIASSSKARSSLFSLGHQRKRVLCRLRSSCSKSATGRSASLLMSGISVRLLALAIKKGHFAIHGGPSLTRLLPCRTCYRTNKFAGLGSSNGGNAKRNHDHGRREREG